METKQMSCGNCGCKTFMVNADDSDFPTILLLECQNCLSQTVYRPAVPKMVQGWGPNSEGVTCFLNTEK